MTIRLLPPVATPVLVAAVDALPARLRKKLDDAVAKYADRTVTESGGRYTVSVDGSTTVTLVTDGGVVRSPDAASCTCLLAPNCLHRAAVLALAPVDAGLTSTDPTATTDPIASAEPGGDGSAGAAAATAEGAQQWPTRNAEQGTVAPTDPAETLTTQQIAAVTQLWRASVAVLTAGVSGSGSVARTALLRAAHDAQACKVYRPAAAARVVASLLQAARTNEAHYRLADLADALRELLGVTHRLLTHPADVAGARLLGSARQAYQLEGSLRLHGLCTTAVLADTGHAGVVTYAADRQGKLWMIADLAPGDARRAATAGNATVSLGETALSHRALTRAGLVVSGATASASRQLGAGKSVRAVTASGVAWHEAPLAALWVPPPAEQIHRAFAALARPITDRVAGSDLLFLSARVLGTDGDAVSASTADGTVLTLRVASDHPALAYRENLRLLGQTTGLEMLLIGRPDPGQPGTVYPLAIAPPTGDGWLLPAPSDGHADLAFDRLHRSHLPAPNHPPAQPNTPDQPDPHETPDAPTDSVPASEDQAHPQGQANTPDQPGPHVTHDAPSGSVPASPPDGADHRPAADRQWRPAAVDPALHLLRVQLERTVAGGRTVLAFSAGRGPSDASRLLRARLDAGAALLDLLTTAASSRHRDSFGRLSDDDGTAFARAWLAAAVYTDAATRAYAEATWLPNGDDDDLTIAGGPPTEVRVEPFFESTAGALNGHP